MRRRYPSRRPHGGAGDENRPASLALRVGAHDTNTDLARQALPRLLEEIARREAVSPSEMLFYLGASLVTVLLRCRASGAVEEAVDDRALSGAIRRTVERDEYERFGPVILVCAYHACTTKDWPDIPGLPVAQERLEQVFWQSLSPANADRFRELPPLDHWHFETDFEGKGKERRLACTAWAKME